MKTKTCKRCDGKGFGTWAPEMGRCYKCFGAGQVEVLTAEEKTAREIAKLKSHLSELEGIGSDLKAAIASQPTRRNLSLNRRLEDTRATWMSVANQLKAVEA